MSQYSEFLQSKTILAVERGLTTIPELKPHLFPFQRQCVEFGLRVGSFGLFLDTGLGKTACELEWARHAADASNGYALILTPLAVARQIEAEGRRWGYDIRVIRSQEDARPGINVCNYDRLQLLEPESFGAVVLDESSIIKNFSGKTTRLLIDTFAQHRWRMAATATPAPNDHAELGTHSEFLGIMPMNDMLVRWFINDTADTGTWRLKGHARKAFWDWLSSWCRMAEHPRDLGDSIDGYDLPKLEIIRHRAEASPIKAEAGSLFGAVDVSATGIHDVKRQTADSRARTVTGIISSPTEPWLVWCDSDYEQDLLEKTIGRHFVSLRGSHPIEKKEALIAAWLAGDEPIMISKPSILGYGLNFQFCANQIFAGRSFSYESWYQAVRRSWRFGQKRIVKIHIVVAEGEDSIGRVIDRKADDHSAMKKEMAEAMRRALGIQSVVRAAYNPDHHGTLPSWL